MYRQNKLKEELDRLREENQILKMENIHLKHVCNEKQLFINTLRLELENKNLLNHIVEGISHKPTIIVSQENAEGMKK